MEDSCPKALLVDADDTLWESSIYFKKVISSVEALLVPFRVAPAVFRNYLDRKECQRIPLNGYGSAKFTDSLVEAVERFELLDADSTLPTKVRQLAEKILYQAPALLDGVPETLEYLSRRHVLLLVTKGNPEEQMRKIEVSNLERHFAQVVILAEKHDAAYRKLVLEHGYDPAQTWMIGNSPRSDINPALSAGLNAIYIPHPHTWIWEEEEPLNHPRLLRLSRFSDLRSYF